MRPTPFLLFAALGLASCKLPRAADFDPVGDPVAGVAAQANFDMPFLEMTGSALPARGLLIPQDSAYRLKAGDVLELEVVDVPGTSARSVVLPDGMLFFDAAHGVRAGGRSVAEIEEALSQQLSETYSFPVVSANLYDVQGNRYTVLGQVKVPGSYPLRQPTTLIDAIASAGGLNSANLSGRTEDLADLGRSVLIRDGKMMPVNFRRLVEEGDMAHNVYMQAGDYVFLPATGNEKVFVLGAVTNPTTIPYSSRVTLISAIAAARGVKEGAYARGVVLIRGSFHEPKVAGVDLRAIVRGEARNFHLQPGDIVWVPLRPWEKLVEYADVALTSIATSVALNEAYKIFGDDEEEILAAATDGVSIEVTPSQEPAPEPSPVPQEAPAPVFEEPVISDPAPAEP